MDGTRAEELVERYADAILRIGYTWLGDMDDAKDICQTVLIKLVEEGRRFPDLGQERAWVVRLSVNACKNWKKRDVYKRQGVYRVVPDGAEQVAQDLTHDGGTEKDGGGFSQPSLGAPHGEGGKKEAHQIAARGTQKGPQAAVEAGKDGQSHGCLLYTSPV